MKRISDKYIIYGRKKGRKKIHSVDKDFFANYIINLETDIKNNKKNIIDVGSGSGENTLFLAKKNPDALIIAIDIFQDGNINLCNQLSNLKLYNVRLFSSNVHKLFDHLNKDNYFNEIWILFPDPWPKKKHSKRRLINSSFVKKVFCLLEENGKIYIATDSISYLVSILYLISNSKLYKWINDRPQKWQYSNENIPKTRYSEKAINNERKSLILVFRKI